jgi:hypothetical protein
VDLCNYGYYWEAHEAWEGFWHRCARKGEMADVFKGLIHLAAAGVKAREGNARGVKRHAARAKELFDDTHRPMLADIACDLANDPPIDPAKSIEGKPVLGVRLRRDVFAVR